MEIEWISCNQEIELWRGRLVSRRGRRMRDGGDRVGDG